MLQHEPPETFRVVHPDTTVDEVRAAFDETFEQLGVRLYAVLVTRSGRARDEVLRIVTSWDLLEGRRAREVKAECTVRVYRIRSTFWS